MELYECNDDCFNCKLDKCMFDYGKNGIAFKDGKKVLVYRADGIENIDGGKRKITDRMVLKVRTINQNEEVKKEIRALGYNFRKFALKYDIPVQQMYYLTSDRFINPDIIANFKRCIEIEKAEQGGAGNGSTV